MTVTRARLWTMGVTAVAVTALSLPAMAAGQGGFGHRGDGPRGPRGDRSHVRRILTPEQMEQVRPWLKTEREASKPLVELRKQLRDAVLADAPDQGKIAGLQAQIATAQSEALTRRTALAQRVARLLTPEQRKQVRESRMVPPFLDPSGHGGPAPFFGGRGPRGGPDAPGPDNEM